MRFSGHLRQTRGHRSHCRLTGTKKPASSVALSGAPAATSIPTDFLAALASSFSMTPAAVSSLPMPSSALPSSSAANSYIQEAWSVKKGSGPLSFVEDPLEGGGGLVLEVDYPKGSYSGAKDVVAGVGNMQMAVFGKSKQRTIVSYEVRILSLSSSSKSKGLRSLLQVGFSAGFDFVKGGKLPGLFGGDSESGCTGGRASESCFSTRRSSLFRLGLFNVALQYS